MKHVSDTQQAADRIENGFRRYEKQALTVLLLAALVIRIYRLGMYSFWGDEVDSIYAGVNRIFFHPPLFIYLASLWVKWAHSECAIRLLATIFSLGAVAATWFLAKRVLQSSHGAFWAALFMVFSPSQVFFARDFRMYSLLTMAAALSWAAYLSWMRRGGRLRFFLTVLTGSMMVYTHHYGFFFIVAQGLSAFVMRPRKKALFKLAAYGSCVFLIYLPYLRLLIYFTRRFVRSSNWAPPITWKTPGYLLRFLLAGLEASYEVAAILVIIGMGLFIAGILKNRDEDFRLLVVFGFFVPILGAMAVSYILPTSMFVARYLIFTGVPLAIAMAAGVQWILIKKKYVIIPLLLITLQFWAITLQYRNIYLAYAVEMREREQFREASEVIADRFKEGDIVGTTCLSGTYPAWFYLTFSREITPMRLVDVDDYHRRHLQYKYNQIDFIGKVYTIIDPINLDTVAASGAYKRIWLFESQWSPGILPGDFYYDQRIRCRNWLAERYPLLEEWSFKGADVRLFDLQNPLEPEENTGADDALNYRDAEIPGE
jgi:hypothetical protein